MEENQLSVSNERLFAGDFSDRLSSSQLLFSSPEESPVNMTLTKERSKAGRNPLHTPNSVPCLRSESGRRVSVAKPLRV